MANLYPQEIASPPQASAEVVVNENFESVGVASIFGKAQATSSALTWGGYGGQYEGNLVADWTVTLTDNATNYIVVNRSTGVVSVATTTTNWSSSTYARIYKVVTASAQVTSELDSRLDTNGLLAPGSTSGTAASLDFDTDGTLAANSDAKIATQKATKTYVDGKVAGLSWKQEVRAATTANGTLATAYANSQAIDGVTLATGDRILLKNQTTGADNGIYVVNASGAPTRATDADAGSELVDASVMVSEGSTLADTQWTCTTNAPITVGSTALAFAQFSTGTGTVTATAGSLTSNRLVLGAGTTDTKVAAGLATDGTSQMQLGVAGASVGSVQLANASTGTVTLQPVTGALGTVTLSLPAATDTLVGKATTDTLTNKTLTNPIVGTQTAGDNSTKAASTAYADRVAFVSIPIAAGDETTAITTGTKVTFRMQCALAISSVRASLTTAQSAGSIFTVDVKQNGTSIFSTLLTIDNTEKTTATAATAAVLSTTALSLDDEMTVLVSQIGTSGAAGLKVYLNGQKSA